MKLLRKALWITLVALALFVAFIFFNNSSLFSPPRQRKPHLLAHRGLAQDYDRTGLTDETCTAARMLPPRHTYLENTLASIQAAFDLGADMVEIDVHPTTDGHFAVFHDWTLNCRTNGTGITRKHTLTELKSLDIAYGYTADGGQTFPFRGQGIGLMPSLDEVLEAFPSRALLINVKSNDPHEGTLLAKRLQALRPERRRLLAVYGGDRPIAMLHEELPDLRTMSRATIKSCFLGYMATGWSGHVPGACANSILFAPINIAPWLWGWPDRFLDRMERAGTQVFIIGPYHEGFSGGFNDPAAFSGLLQGFTGGISTDRIDLIGPLFTTDEAGQCEAETL